LTINQTSSFKEPLKKYFIAIKRFLYEAVSLSELARETILIDKSPNLIDKVVKLIDKSPN